MANSALVDPNQLIDSGQFLKELDKVNKAVQQWSGRLTQITNEVAEAFSASAAIITGGFDKINSAIDKASKIQEQFSDKISSTLKALEKLPDAIDLSGVEDVLLKVSGVAELLQGRIDSISEAVAAMSGQFDETVEAILEKFGSLIQFGEELPESVGLWIENLRERLLTEIPEIWESLTERIGEYAGQFSELWDNTFDLFTEHFHEAIATMLLEGESFSEVMRNVAGGFAKSMVAALVEIATNRLTLWAMEKGILGQQAKGDVARIQGEAQAGVELASLNAYSSTAAIPVTGPAQAPGASAVARAFTQPMAIAATAAAAASLAGMAHSGINDIPEQGTWLLDKNERVLSSGQNKDLTDFLTDEGSHSPEINNQFTFVIEAGAGQQADEDLADNLYTLFTSRLISDAKTNGPVRRAMIHG